MDITKKDIEQENQIIFNINHNYVAFFLTFSCNLNCDYCINTYNMSTRRMSQHLKPSEWIRAASRLVLRDDLPLTLQGGEPTLYNGFYEIVNDVKAEIKMDLMTNLQFDVAEFIRKVPVERFIREAPYAPIRVSYHPSKMNLEDLIHKTLLLMDSGFRVGIYGIEHPDKKIMSKVLIAKEKCQKVGIDFRTKEFLGFYDGTLYGTYKYPDGVGNNKLKRCFCKTTELLVDPAGYIYRCHSDLYNGRTPIGHILDKTFNMDEIDKYRQCNFFGNCNPCDLKVKTNRFQIYGHTSVSIKDIR